MAAKKKAKKAARKKAPAKKAVKKKTAKPAKKAKKVSKKKPTKKVVKAAARKAPAKKASKKKTVKKKQVVGEGNYAASAKFDADQAGFVKRNKTKIPALAKAAETALEGPEGDGLRAAEAAAAGRSRDTFEP